MPRSPIGTTGSPVSTAALKAPSRKGRNGRPDECAFRKEEERAALAEGGRCPRGVGHASGEVGALDSEVGGLLQHGADESPPIERAMVSNAAFSASVSTKPDSDRIASFAWKTMPPETQGSRARRSFIASMSRTSDSSTCSRAGAAASATGSLLTPIAPRIDKDLASAVLARSIGAERLVMLTGEPYVFPDYGTPTQKPVPTLSAREARQHLDEGQFPAGSMGPKIEAALEFLAGGGREVLITSIEGFMDALAEKTGTRITP